MIWCGDFNSHSSLWGCEHTDHNGVVVKELLDIKGLCLNDGSGTRIDIGSGKRSAIDLTFVYDNLASKSNWTVLTQNIGSDHFPILYETGINIQKKGGGILKRLTGINMWKAVMSI